MKLQEDKRYDLYFFDRNVTKTLEFVLNRLLSKKYEWFNSLKLKNVLINTMSPWQGIYVFYQGVLHVDENWGRKMWKDENQYGEFPSNKDFDYEKYNGTLLNTLLSSKMISEISEIFTLGFRAVKPINETPNLSKIGTLLLYFDESEKEMNLQEHIRKVLREETYSPAGKEIKPNKIVVHKSNPIFRNKISKEGLKAQVGECYQIYVNRDQREPNKIKCKPVIFATNSTRKRDLFDSTYDDDMWEIDTEVIPDVKWYKDKHFGPKNKHILTFQDIPKEAITLKYEGSGESEDLLQEQIRKVLREELDKKIVCQKCGWSWKLSEGGDDPYTCHKCGNTNEKSELTEKCWAGYTQKGMKTMFGKRYPNCVKKTKK